MSSQQSAFAPYHAWDRNFFLGFVLLCWFGVVMGFAPASIGRLAGKADYVAPLVLHVHAVAFVGWLLLLTSQTLLIRRRNLALHRKLGLISLALIPVMAVTAVAAEIYSQRYYLDHPPNSQAFFIIPLFYIAAFTPLALGAVVMRSKPAAHKRLILLATTILIGAAYTRWWGAALTAIVGDGYVGMIINTFTATNLIMLVAMAYDFATRMQIHKVYRLTVPAILVGELVTSWLYHSPAWLPVARWIVGR